MLKSKQNKDIVNKQELIYTEPKFSKSQQQKTSETNQSNVQSREQQVDYMELKFPRSSHLQHRKQKKGKVFSNKEDPNQKISPVPTPSSKNDECSCDRCSTHWIGFGSSSYYLSCKAKTWVESHAACEELNTHLLKIDIKAELELLSMLEVKGWIGLKINETSESWLWEDGTTVIENLFGFLKMEKDGCAYIEGNYVYPANCSSGKSYVCEFTV
ncbi:killer cell lectin-like receptor subfamily I member 1 isoform 2-T4 [Dama dama]|uniref:killer cell lectin-like receptor subfamily I member 1 isoform X2 n=1 Tax=Dama dama TaxID=30532 RepID=UPI002A358758|nr:killer cell lectin-like receptor subfamily I member 1 isoform X2 [Dama dama]